jgi:predicted Zn-dependent protease with MMP-like domain
VRSPNVALNQRLARLARYRTARRRASPATSMRAFEELVADVLDNLPPYIRVHLENVAVLVDEGANSRLLGLYEGVNRLERTSGYHLATPDRITLYWKPLVGEARSSDTAAIREEVRKTIIHEIAHHFGIGDAELERLGG